MVKRIISLLLCFAILFVLVVPAFAEDSPQPLTFWGYIGSLIGDSGSFGGPVEFFEQVVDSIKAPGECPDSPTGYHSWNFSHPVTLLTGYLDWQCDYCHAHYSEYASAGEEQYLTDNNLTGLEIAPDGGFIWTPTVTDLVSFSDDYYIYASSSPNRINATIYRVLCSQITSNNISFPFSGNISSSSSSFSFSYFPPADTYTALFVTPGSFRFSVPFSGFYSYLDDSFVSLADGSTCVSSISFSPSSFSSGSYLDFSFNKVSRSFSAPYSHSNHFFYVHFPSFSFVPFSSIVAPSIPSTITVDNDTYNVVNFNPSTRTYNVTNNDGDDISITYGDNTYTVTNNTTNTTVNNYYYITNNNGGGDSGGGSSGSGSDYTSILNQIKDLLTQILDAIPSGGGTVPSGSLPEDVDDSTEIGDWFTNTVNKFGWVNQIYSVILQLFNDVSNDSLTAYAVYDGFVPGEALTYSHSGHTAPAVSLTFPDVTVFGFNFGGYYLLDFSWYAPYKPAVDSLLSGFMWLTFVVILFRQVPSIVRGGAAVESSLGKIDDYLDKHSP